MSSLRRVFSRHWMSVVIVVFMAWRISLQAEETWPLRSILFALAIVGIVMNLTVIVANGGMPAAVTPEQISPQERLDYKVIDTQTRLVYLADWIPFGNYMISPGDIVLAISALGFVSLPILGL